jgi:hypothetical protein
MLILKRKHSLSHKLCLCILSWSPYGARCCGPTPDYTSRTLLVLFRLKCRPAARSRPALTALAGWSLAEHLSLYLAVGPASDVTDGPTASRPTPMVVKKSFALRVAVPANSIAGYDQLLFARLVCTFVSSSSSCRLPACQGSCLNATWSWWGFSEIPFEDDCLGRLCRIIW